MKKTFLWCATACMMLAQVGSAFAKNKEFDEYRRSSVNFVLLDVSEGDAEIAELVKKSFVEMEVPIKYNNHNVSDEVRVFNLSSIEVTEEDHNAYNEFIGKKSSGNGKALGALAGGLMGGDSTAPKKEFSPAKKNSPVAAWKYLNQTKMANLLLQKWFINPEKPTELSIDLLRERANFNATETEKLAAATSSRGAFDQIADDAGYELLNNTFTAVTRLRYMSADDMYNEIVENAEVVAQYLPAQAQGPAMEAAKAAATAAKLAIGDGYVIYSTTYLYQLVWNDDVQASVENNWLDPEKFKSHDGYSLRFVGQENAYANILGKKFPREQAIKLAVKRTMEKVLAKLERKYEVFRTKSPLVSVEPLLADIGTKECVEKGDKYEVLEKSIDPKTQKPIYKRKALLVVNTVGNNIDDGSEEVDGSMPKQTTFNGKAKGLYPGMLIRQTSK